MLKFSVYFITLISIFIGSNLYSEPTENVKDLTKNPIVRIQTTKGDIFIRLHTDKAPLTCKNFLNYVKDGFYTGTIFHRVIDGFLIQAGGFNSNLDAKNTRAPIKNESRVSMKNKRGTVGMALTMDPNSAASQFYINVVDNPTLDYDVRRRYGYTVFGEVIEGMNIVDSIKKVKTHRVSYYSTLYKRYVPLYEVPVTPITINGVHILR